MCRSIGDGNFQDQDQPGAGEKSQMAATPQETSNLEAAFRRTIADIKVIDSDTHLSEPHDLWTSRAPRQWKERVPQVKEKDGKLMWVIDGDKSLGYPTPASVIRKSGEKIRGWGFMQCRMEDVHPGSFDIKERLRYMDETGIWAQIIYPNFLGFGGSARRSFPRISVCSPSRFTTTRWPRFSRSRATGCFRWRCCRGGTSTCACRRRFAATRWACTAST